MTAEIIRKLASRVLRAEVSARNAKDVNSVIDAISTRIRFAEDGDIIVVDRSGARISGKTFESFLDDVKVDRPDLFRGAGQANDSGNANPFIKGANFSITKQMFLIRSNPELAAEYQAEAEATR